MRQSLKEQLKAWKKDRMEIRQHGKKKRKKRSNDELSTRDIKKLMGMDRPIYSRGKGGAFRQR